MLLRHHTLLCQHKRFRYLLEQGVYLAGRYTDSEEILLFQLPQSYVEVAFAREAETIFWIKCFTNTDDLEPYLETISIAPAFDA
jgi:hypothetical protein